MDSKTPIGIFSSKSGVFVEKMAKDSSMNLATVCVTCNWAETRGLLQMMYLQSSSVNKKTYYCLGKHFFKGGRSAAVAIVKKPTGIYYIKLES